MTTVTTLPQSRPLTYTDLDSMPDDGHRYELLDGALIVTPAPRPSHQRAVAQLHLLLSKTCPDDLEVFFAPVDVLLTDDTALQPDLLVVRREDVAERNVPAVPVLAVEILSPSTRLIDLTVKKARYEQAGCPSYWVIDPDEPAVVVWELRDGRYDEVTRATSDETVTVDQPFPVALTPDLLAGPRR